MVNPADRRANNRPRRPFSPERYRKPEFRAPQLPLPDDWKDRVPSAVVRMLVGATFIALPAFEVRLGGLALPFVCMVLAALCGVAAWLMSRSEALRSWSINATDVLTLAILTPVVSVASSIGVSDSRLGGSAGHFLSAVVAVLAALAIVTIVCCLLNAETVRTAGVALLPAVLLVAATIAAAERFTADRFGQALTAAWMIAGLATMIDGLIGRNGRIWLPIITFALFMFGLVAIQSNRIVEISRTNAGLAFLATAIAGMALLIATPLSERMREFVVMGRRSGRAR